jgi:hypothetical protein
MKREFLIMDMELSIEKQFELAQMKVLVSETSKEDLEKIFLVNAHRLLLLQNHLSKLSAAIVKQIL